MKTYVVTFVYPGAQKWFTSYLSSLDKQTDYNFELVIFQDQEDFSNQIGTKSYRIHYFTVDEKMDLYAIRLQALKILKEKFGNDLFILSDIDDQLALTRVEVTKTYFKDTQTQMGFSDLSLMDEVGKTYLQNIWKNRIRNHVESADLKYGNMIGFGSIALRGSVIPDDILNYHASVLAADWYLFDCLLRDTKIEAIFIPYDLVLYRQHNQNSAGLKNIDESRLLHDVSVKISHFNALYLRYGKKSDLEMLESYRKLEKFIQIIDNRLIYINKLTKSYHPHLFWWEHIKTLNELGIS
jgi:hypothetical protein